MPVNTLLDLPTKEKLATDTDTLDAVIDSDFELDLRVFSISTEKLPMAASEQSICWSCHDSCDGTCFTCVQSYCYPCWG